MSLKGSDKSQISQHFWQSAITIGTIVTSTIIATKYIENGIQEAIKPLIVRIEKLEGNDLRSETKINQLIYYNKLQDRTAIPYYDFINARFKTGFIKPDDLEIKTEE